MRWCNWVFGEDCNWKAVSGDIIHERWGKKNIIIFLFFCCFFLTGDLKRNIRRLMRFQCRGLMSVRGRTAEASGCSGTLMWVVREPLSNSSLSKKQPDGVRHQWCRSLGLMMHDLTAGDGRLVVVPRASLCLKCGGEWTVVLATLQSVYQKPREK